MALKWDTVTSRSVWKAQHPHAYASYTITKDDTYSIYRVKYSYRNHYANSMSIEIGSRYNLKEAKQMAEQHRAKRARIHAPESQS